MYADATSMSPDTSLKARRLYGPDAFRLEVDVQKLEWDRAWELARSYWE